MAMTTTTAASAPTASARPRPARGARGRPAGPVGVGGGGGAAGGLGGLAVATGLPFVAGRGWRRLVVDRRRGGRAHDARVGDLAEACDQLDPPAGGEHGLRRA